MDSDAELLCRVGHDRDAFEQFYVRHVGRVRAFAARRCANAGDVADAVSATFLTVIDAAEGYDARRGRASAWLLGIAAHEIAALYRGEAREQATVRRIAGRRLLQSDDIARLEAQIDAERLAPQVSAALARAPKAERELLMLVAYDGLTPSEAARVLGITAVAARVRLARARRRLAAAQPLSSGPPASTEPKEQA